RGVREDRHLPPRSSIRQHLASIRPRRDPPAAIDLDRLVDGSREVLARGFCMRDYFSVVNNLQVFVRLQRLRARLDAQFRLSGREMDGLSGSFLVHAEFKQRVIAREGTALSNAVDPGSIGEGAIRLYVSSRASHR